MRNFVAIGLMAAALGSCAQQAKRLQTPATEFASDACEAGVYGSPDAFVVITRRNDTSYYSFNDGRNGKVADESAVECGDGGVRIEQAEILAKQPTLVTDIEFDSGGVMLAGQLIEPADAGPNTPLVVLAHGSEESGWIEAVSYPYQLAGRGVSVFVYDKRGTGRSAGDYSQNFPQLADDLVAASLEAKRLAGARFGRFGLFGFSQGGWIAPLAAKRSGTDFIGIGYGLVVDILEEDASQVELELREAGYGDDVIAKAREITDVTARLAVSGYSDGLQDLDALREKYGDAQWYSIVRGGFTGVILGMSTDELRDDGIPMFDRLNIDWSIKPMDVLRDVDVPQLWALAQNDREAPVAKTLERLQTLRAEGQDITIFSFPNTDHGMWEYEQGPDGGRTYTRVTDEYYRLLADWAKGSLQSPYAKSKEQ
ncbi:MAG: alpha/beta fold hydrolase [Pseudomonadota bacterium]